jgi:hypothetical protein
MHLFLIQKAHDALHSEGCTSCNDPVMNVSADEMTTVDAANHCGAGVAVPAACVRYDRALTKKRL